MRIEISAVFATLFSIRNMDFSERFRRLNIQKHRDFSATEAAVVDCPFSQDSAH
jgi:hypothetical protein